MRSYDRSHVWLVALELRQNVLDDKLFHVSLHVWMAHDEVTEGGRHVEGTETLRRGWLPVANELLDPESTKIYVRAQNAVDEAKDGHERDFCAVARKRQQE